MTNKTIRNVLRATGIALLSFVAAPATSQSNEEPQPLVVERLLENDALKGFENHNLLAVRSTVARGASGSTHTHPGPEVLYVLRGHGQISLNGRTKELNVGDVVLVPENTVKMVTNLSEKEEFQYLAVLFVKKGEPVSNVLDRVDEATH